MIVGKEFKSTVSGTCNKWGLEMLQMKREIIPSWTWNDDKC